MANFEINEEQAALIRELRKLETSDPVHADVYNALFGKLINNDAFLERLANKMIEKSMLCHVLDSVNAQQVLAADVGPKITAIIDGLQEDVNGLNTNNPYKLKSGQIVCTYRDAGYLQGIIDVSGFSTYKVLVTFDGDSDGFGTENPIPFVINNIVYARSTNRNFNTGSSIAFNYLVIGK